MVTITLSIAAEYEDTYRPNTGTNHSSGYDCRQPRRFGRVLRSNAMRRCPMCCHRAAYQTNGIRRRRTLFRYPRQPGSSLASNFSSSKILHISAGTIRRNTKKFHHDPSARHMPTNRERPPMYIGWRTSAYRPVDMTFCSGYTSIVAEAKAFALYTTNMMRKPIATRTSPASVTPRGIADQPKRWSSAGTTSIATNPRAVIDWIIFWLFSFSAVGPA